MQLIYYLVDLHNLFKTHVSFVVQYFPDIIHLSLVTARYVSVLFYTLSTLACYQMSNKSLKLLHLMANSVLFYGVSAL